MTHETPKWQTLWLLVGFGLLIGIGVVTVLLPELRDQRSEEEAGIGDERGDSGDSVLQE